MRARARRRGSAVALFCRIRTVLGSSWQRWLDATGSMRASSARIASGAVTHGRPRGWAAWWAHAHHRGRLLHVVRLSIRRRAAAAHAWRAWTARADEAARERTPLVRGVRERRSRARHLSPTPLHPRPLHLPRPQVRVVRRSPPSARCGLVEMARLVVDVSAALLLHMLHRRPQRRGGAGASLDRRMADLRCRRGRTGPRSASWVQRLARPLRDREHGVERAPRAPWRAAHVEGGGAQGRWEAALETGSVRSRESAGRASRMDRGCEAPAACVCVPMRYLHDVRYLHVPHLAYLHACNRCDELSALRSWTTHARKVMEGRAIAAWRATVHALARSRGMLFKAAAAVLNRRCHQAWGAWCSYVLRRGAALEELRHSAVGIAGGCDGLNTWAACVAALSRPPSCGPPRRACGGAGCGGVSADEGVRTARRLCGLLRRVLERSALRALCRGAASGGARRVRRGSADGSDREASRAAWRSWAHHVHQMGRWYVWVVGCATGVQRRVAYVA